MTDKIKNGTTVTWRSQVRGSWKTKTGVVTKYLEPGVDAREFIGKSTKSSRLQNRTPESGQTRYLVKSEDKQGNAIFYTPRASVLEASIVAQGAAAEKKAAKAAPAAKKAKAEKKPAKVKAAPAAKKAKAEKKVVKVKAAPAAKKTKAVIEVKKTKAAKKNADPVDANVADAVASSLDMSDAA